MEEEKVNDTIIPHNTPDNPIKVDGEMHKFGSATRMTKDGKGRTDLIPPEVVFALIEDARNIFENDGGFVSATPSLLTQYAYCPNEITTRCYSTIMHMVILVWCNGQGLHKELVRKEWEREVTFKEYMQGFNKMLLELSHHYENGAKHYGVDNWKKGIPIIGGDEGGSFMDSMLRHLAQFQSSHIGYVNEDGSFHPYDEQATIVPGDLLFDALTRKCWIQRDAYIEEEEPHHLAVIWNAFGALWTLLTHFDTFNEHKDNDQE